MAKKNKLQKFDDMAGYDNVFQYCFEQLLQPGQEDEPRQGFPIEELTGFPMRGRWHEDFFHNGNPIVVELGCGKGEYTVGLAERYPDKNFIGVDIKGARMWTGATQAQERGLKNVAFIRTRIELITAFFTPGEVSEIWITFADPQMKKVNKRLTCTMFMQRYLQIMGNHGMLHLKTDSNFLFTYTEEMARANGLQILAETRDLHHDDQFATPEIIEALRNIRTAYETQWMARGIDIKYLSLLLGPRPSWTEPEVEIELDSYRSYGRDKRSALEVHV